MMPERRPANFSPVQEKQIVAETQEARLARIHCGEISEIPDVITLKNVAIDFSLVDEAHAEEIEDSFKTNPRGQVSPITVRAREVDGEIMYDIIDGFHRTEAAKRKGQEDIKAIVLYGCSNQEMFDLRISAANSVRSVQFPRIAEWISRSWQETEWSEKVSPIQAFTLAVNDREKSYLVEDESLKEIKSWVKSRCKRWMKTAPYVLGILRTVEAADPELVKQVRISGGGKDREGKVTPARLQTIAMAFPGKENYQWQNLLMNFSVENRLAAKEITNLVEEFKPKLEGELHQEEAQKTLAEIYEKQKLQNMTSKNSAMEEGHDDERDVTEIFDMDPTDDELINIETLSVSPESKRLRDELLVEQIARDADRAGNNNEPFVRQKLSFNGNGRKHPVIDSKIRLRQYTSYEDLLRQNEDLRTALAQANSSGSNIENAWWRTASFLTPEERGVMKDLFDNCDDMEKVSKKTKIPVNRIIILVQSAFKKRSLINEQQLAKKH